MRVSTALVPQQTLPLSFFHYGSGRRLEPNYSASTFHVMDLGGDSDPIIQLPHSPITVTHLLCENDCEIFHLHNTESPIFNLKQVFGMTLTGVAA